jgi:hypothetical protein
MGKTLDEHIEGVSQALRNMRSVCAWRGCAASCLISNKPHGWVNLLTWWSACPEPDRTVAQIATGPHCKRDVILCPMHAAELESLLKGFGKKLGDTVGNA